MKIFLPPSETKKQPAAGSRLDLAGLAFPELTELREMLITEVEEVSSSPGALNILKVGPGRKDDVTRQTQLSHLPCASALEIYTGVLYEAMGTINMAYAENVLIFSGLFGVTRADDLIPAYRLAMGVALPSAGNVAALWKRALKPLILAREKELVVDCRSGAYKVWNPPPEADWVNINAVQIIDGARKVVSHHAKHFRGVLAGELLRSSEIPNTAEELADFSRILVDSGVVSGIELEPADAVSPTKPRSLTLVIS